MARPRKSDAPDLSEPHELTLGVIDRLSCPDGKAQAFLRDVKTPALRVRVTVAGAKSFVFEAKFKRRTIRRTIGDVRSWSIDEARVEARRLSVMLDTGKDPREVDRAEHEAGVAREAAARAQAITVGDLWPAYMAEGRPKRKEKWKDGYRADLELMVSKGGVAKKRGTGETRAGPLFPLMAQPLREISEDSLKAWYDTEAKAGRHQAARALMMFRGFLRWCAGKAEYRDLIDSSAGRAESLVRDLPSVSKRTDSLEAAQLPAWFKGIATLPNRTAATYLQVLLLTGARREEVAGLKWTQVDHRWKRLTLADKVDATRVIPLSPYVAKLVDALPRTNEFVFASAAKSGRIADPRSSHASVLKQAEIEALSLHGLRRTFALQGEAAGAPAGAIAQIMGHRPSAVADGYKPRSLDALRPYLGQIEAHILATAKVRFNPTVDSDVPGADSSTVVKVGSMRRG